MSQRLYKLARQYGRSLNPKQHKIFLLSLTSIPFFRRKKKGLPSRAWLAIRIFFKVPLVKFTKKEEVEIKTGKFLK